MHITPASNEHSNITGNGSTLSGWRYDGPNFPTSS